MTGNGDIEHATFLAAFPPIQSAIKVYGDSQGMRVQLDIPESDMAEALKILPWRGQILMVTIVPVDEDGGRIQGQSRKIHI